MKPWINYINPANPTANGYQQSFTVYGGGITSSTTVTLRDLTTGIVYANRPINWWSSNAINLSPNFGNVSHLWSVELLNGSVSSGQCFFSGLCLTIPPCNMTAMNRLEIGLRSPGWRPAVYQPGVRPNNERAEAQTE